ncbi:MAG TPA: CYTH and CHAD domain-containing protein [Acidimicrobiales bacterium]|nr:CYTH and CHAD domain-containing protein [Acidimicrobiales bacterium]
MGASLERELKVEVDDSFHVPDLSASVGVSVVSLPEVALEATYYDTTGYHLGRWGATLRHRISSAGSHTWTLKLPAAALDADDQSERPSGALERDELDFDGPADKIPPDAMALLRTYLRADVVAPVAVLKTRRRRNLLMSATDTLAEMDDDTVEFRSADGRTGTFRELEIELAENGPVPILRQIHDVLVAAGVADTAAQPKLFRAIGGTPEPAVRPVPAEWSRSMSTAELVAVVLARSVGRLLSDDPRVRLGDDPEALARWRAELGRLAVAMEDTHRVLDTAWCEEVGDGLEQLRRPVDALADLDLLVGRLTAGASRLLPEDQAAALELVDIVASQRKSHHEALADHLDSPAYLDLVDRLAAAAAEPPVRPGRSRPATATAERAVHGRLDRLGRSAADALGKGFHPALRDRGDDDEGVDLTVLARSATEARASAELAAHLAGRPAAKLHRALAELDGWLGELGAATAGQRWLRATGSELDGRLAVAAGQLLAGETNCANRARRHWTSAWKAVQHRAEKWPKTR